MNQVVKTYKGYEIHPLVYPRRPADGTTSRNPDAGYEASVRICRVGANPAADGRVFRCRICGRSKARARPASLAWRTLNS
jgi:hypothetical protein